MFSKEPLGPVVAVVDSEWARVVETVVSATIQAEAYGLTSANVLDVGDDTDPALQRFIGFNGDAEAATDEVVAGSLPEDFALQVVSQVGNYGEIFDRNLASLGVERDLNAQWTDGDLMYSPPFV